VCETPSRPDVKSCFTGSAAPTFDRAGKNAKDRAQSFLFDQNRVTVLVKAAFLLPLPGKRKLTQP
jgi:hypothetical protein